ARDRGARRVDHHQAEEEEQHDGGEEHPIEGELLGHQALLSPARPRTSSWKTSPRWPKLRNWSKLAQAGDSTTASPAAARAAAAPRGAPRRARRGAGEPPPLPPPRPADQVAPPRLPAHQRRERREVGALVAAAQDQVDAAVGEAFERLERGRRVGPLGVV